MTGGKLKRLSHFVTALAAAAFLLSGCNGGSDGAAGVAGAPGVPGAPGTPGKDLTATVTVPSNAVPASSDVSAAWAALAPQVTISSVTIASAPVVKFTVKDAAGKAVVGLGNKSQSATATVAGLTNVAFTLAKLVPGTNGSPSKWVSYNVVSPPTVAQKTAVPATSSCNAATNATWCGTFPTTDTQGTLVDNGDGSYQYTFFRDPKQVAAIVASLTDSVDTLSKKADLGDLSFDPTLTHRLGIQIGGNAPGTGSNTPNAVTVTPAVAMVNTGNAVYDFRPDGGSLTSTRNIVKIDSCSGCHAGKVLAHGSRKDPQYCVTCHTDQIKFSFSQEASSTNGGLTLTGTTRQTTAVVDGRALGNFPNMLHHIHMGEELVKQGYFFNASSEGKFNDVKYPQDQRNCVKCHDGSATAVNKTANGDNWKNVPSRLACGACHDGINFATGGGINLSGSYAGHIGGAKADDSLCTVCHSANDIATVYHVAVTPIAPAIVASGVASGYTNAASIAAYTGNLPAGASKITFAMGNVTVNANRNAVVQFKILKDGAAVVFNTYSPTGKTEIMDNFIGSPSVQVAFAVPQDGITAPSDFNYNGAAYLKTLWMGTAPTTVGTLSATPDASGYYTATLTGIVIPTTATMVTAGIGYQYSLPASQPLTQTNVSGYAFNATTKVGGLIVEPANVWKVATGSTPRRSIVENARCNNCHEKLGVFAKAAYHAGQRNDAPTCAFCHNPNQTSSGWSAGTSTYIHGIHGGSKRTQAFNWHAASATDGFYNIGYPGVLKNCEQCHLPNTYNFGNAYTKANESATPTATAFNNATADNMLYSTVGKGIYTASDSQSPYASLGVDYGSGFAFSATTGAITQAAGTTLVNSPIASACFSCHDSSPALAHIRANGGSIYAPRSTALATKEQCLICHAAGKVADVKVMHQ